MKVKRCTHRKPMFHVLPLTIHVSFSLSQSFLASYLYRDVKYKSDESAGKAATSNYKVDEVAFRNP